MGNESTSNWIAGASVYSGRPDPTWPVDAGAAARLVRQWEALPVTSDARKAAPALGYRGCFLRDAAGHEWRAFRGIAETDRDGRRDVRQDADRTFERALLATAPAGLLPPHIAD